MEQVAFKRFLFYRMRYCIIGVLSADKTDASYILHVTHPFLMDFYRTLVSNSFERRRPVSCVQGH